MVVSSVCLSLLEEESVTFMASTWPKATYRVELQ
jgi:hypothetical protein